MSNVLPRWLPLALLTLAALLWRAGDLSSRPMHADEANQAVKAGILLETGRYAFDPADHHGPVLYYAVLPVAWFRDRQTLAELDETTVRLVPAVAGAASVLLLGLLALPLGRWTSLAAAAFLAASPPSVYYSGYFIQETLLTTFTLSFLVCARQWLARPRACWAAAAGASLGLMQATKESAPLYVAAAALAWLAARRRPDGPEGRHAARDLLIGAAAALAVAAVFYSSFGENPGGLRDALATYGTFAARLRSWDTGHEKPWWYYARLFAWQRSGGLVFEQAGFAALAVAGLAVALRNGPRLLRWAAAYTLILLFALSATPYKTPWLSVQLVPGLALLASGAVGALGAAPRGRPFALAAAAAVLAMLSFQSVRVSRTYAHDPRNPYAYVHSSPDVLEFRSLADEALRRFPEGAIRVISEEYWPLPWYFRGLKRVGYWTRPPEDCDAALVVASADLADTVRSRLHGAYSVSYLGLRPGFACIVFSRTP